NGTLVLDRNSVYTGDTRIEGGRIVLADGMTGSDFLVGADGSLGGHGTVAGDVHNAGTVHSASQVHGADGTLRVGGNYVQDAGGTLDAVIGRPFQVDGSATLAGTLNISGVASGYVAVAREGVLHAGGGVSGA